MCYECVSMCIKDSFCSSCLGFSVPVCCYLFVIGATMVVYKPIYPASQDTTLAHNFAKY